MALAALLAGTWHPHPAVNTADTKTREMSLGFSSDEGDPENPTHQPDPDDEGEEGIDDQMDLEGHEAVVTSHSELAAAIASATITDIYLGADIVMESGGIIIHQNKPYLVIDGVDPGDPLGVVHSITQNASPDYVQTIRMEYDSGTKDIVLRNLLVYGANHYGLVYVAEGVKDVYILYDNIEYYGPQLTFNQNGTSHYRNCNVTIGKYAAPSSPGEVGETSCIILEGNVTLSQNRNEINDNEIFFIDKKKGFVRVMEGANVEVNASNTSGFLYSHYTTPMTVEKNAVFRYNGVQQFWESNPLSSLTVEEGAEVYLNVPTMNARTLLRVDGNLTVKRGATLHLIGAGNTSYPVLYINGGSATFTDPKSVLLYNAAYRPVMYATAGPFTLEAQQLNYWKVAGDGGWDDPMEYQWRTADGSNLTMSATVDAGGNFTAITGSNADPAGLALTPENFALSSSRVVSFGRLPLTADFQYLDADTSQVYGETEVEALVRAYQEEEDREPMPGGDVQALTGSYVMTLDNDYIIPHDKVRVTALHHYLRTSVDVTAAFPGLYLQSVPERIRFQTTPLVTQPRLVGRAEETEPITVVDYRGAGAGWKLTARALTPLHPVSGNAPALSGALVFVDGEGGIHSLEGQTAVVVYRHLDSGQASSVTLEWQADKGILADIAPGTAYADVAYEAAILWTLEEVP